MFGEIDDHAQGITAFCRYFHNYFSNFNNDLTCHKMSESLNLHPAHPVESGTVPIILQNR